MNACILTFRVTFRVYLETNEAATRNVPSEVRNVINVALKNRYNNDPNVEYVGVGEPKILISNDDTQVTNLNSKKLTIAEKKFLEEWSSGMSISQIAKKLGISKVRAYQIRKNIIRKVVGKSEEDIILEKILEILNQIKDEPIKDSNRKKKLIKKRTYHHS
jgi:DNA-binding CsgD family transcriptional regulator